MNFMHSKASLHFNLQLKMKNHAKAVLCSKGKEILLRCRSWLLEGDLEVSKKGLQAHGVNDRIKDAMFGDIRR